jgi:hypothetical protein
VKDLYDDDEIVNDIQNEGNMIFEEEEIKEKNEKKNKQRHLNKNQIKELDDSEFLKKYTRAGGVQHIICSATLTIDKQGRITPRQMERDKRDKLKVKKGLK